MALAISNGAIELLRNDLAAFADPGTLVDFEPHGQYYVGHWQQRGKPRTARFTFGENPDLRDMRVDLGSGPVAYPSFLASDQMADLRGVARNTLTVIAEVPTFVPLRGSAEGAATALADDLIEQMVRAEGQTAVVFVTADAGTGKTTTLTELVRQKAAGYVVGEEKAVWLYVNAQGSRLARLDQALAATLDDVRALFPYHAAASLVRTGAAVLVVDGFDELIGTQGTYDEAFSSLASFIEQLHGSGSLVAAARSAYYEQEFATRADSTIGFRTAGWMLRRVTLSEWNETERRLYLQRLSEHRRLSPEAAEDLERRVLRTFSHSDVAPLAFKPLFVTRVALLLADGTELEQGSGLVERLVSTYLRRESSEKLLSTRGVPLLSPDKLQAFYAEIANEMWRQETRELSRTSLRDLVAILSEMAGLDDVAIRVVTERTPYSAVMRTGSTEGSVAFEHELYFAHFLAPPIVETIRTRNTPTIALVLRKARLPSHTGSLVGSALRADVQSVIELLVTSVVATATGQEQVRENAGVIVAGVFQGHEVSGLRVHDLSFTDCDLSKSTLRETRLDSCVFRGVNLAGTQLVRCRGADLLFDGIIVDDSTKIELADVPVESFVSIVIERGGSRQPLYSPGDVRDELHRRGLASAKEAARVRVVSRVSLDLLQRLCRIYERTNIATEEDQGPMQHIVRDKAWPQLRRALLASGVIREETREASPRGNRPKLFMRMTVRPSDLLAGQAVQARVESKISDFWGRISSAN